MRRGALLALLLAACADEGAAVSVHQSAAEPGWVAWGTPEADLPPPTLAPVDPTRLPPSLRPLGTRLDAAGAELSAGGTLHEARVLVHGTQNEAPRTIEQRGVALVVPERGADGRAWALVGRQLVPVVAMGPALDLASECGPGASVDRCPTEAWWTLAAAGHADTAETLLRERSPHGGPMEVEAAALVHVRLATAIDRFVRGDDEGASREFDEVGRVRRALSRSEELGEGSSVAALREEIQRRATRPRVSRAEIEAAVDALEDTGLIASEGVAQPSSLAAEPHVRAVVALGDAALPALVDCLASAGDRRTRVVLGWGWRDEPGYHLERLDTVCAAALDLLGGADVFFLVHTGSRAEAVAALRARIASWGSEPSAERHLRVLGDDDATSAEWVAAANWLVGAGLWAGVRSDPMRGEPLRARRSDELLDRLAERAGQVLDAQPQHFCSLVEDARAWDERGAAQRLASLTTRASAAQVPCAETFAAWARTP